jgi:hypothetical protein
VNKQEARCKKHGMKIINEYHIPEEHTVYVFYEAPSLEAFQRYCLEPEILAMGAYETAETKIVYSIEEAKEILKERKSSIA